jgi:hypothetical protein
LLALGLLLVAWRRLLGVPLRGHVGLDTILKLLLRSEVRILRLRVSRLLILGLLHRLLVRGLRHLLIRRLLLLILRLLLRLILRLRLLLLVLGRGLLVLWLLLLVLWLRLLVLRRHHRSATDGRLADENSARIARIHKCKLLGVHIATEIWLRSIGCSLDSNPFKVFTGHP